MSETQYFNLSSIDTEIVNETTDICIIGAGAVGIYLATRLAESGFRVVLVEAGNSSNQDPSEAGFVVNFKHSPYPGATAGRAFGLGGSTTRWGGLLVPHTNHDIRLVKDQDATSSWSQIIETVAKYTDDVLKRLGYPESGNFFEFPQAELGNTYLQYKRAGLDIVASLFLPFSQKNLSFLLKAKAPRRSPIRVYTGAVVKAWTLEQKKEGDTHVTQLQAISENKKILYVGAKRFLITAGAIESSRLLLELQATAPVPPIRSTAAIGCFLADHLSVTIANINEVNKSMIGQHFAPRFSRNWMRSFRFLESSPPAGQPRAFLHFIFENDDSGFLLAKEVLSALQARRRPRLSINQAISGATGLLALADARYRRSRLHIAPDTGIHLQLDIEQTPVRRNHIALSDELDRFQRRMIDIHWEVSDGDIKNIQTTATRIIKKWPISAEGSSTLMPVADLHTGPKPHDAYHPVGVCRMGVDPEAVVDPDLRVWGMANMWVVSTAVLPSAGTANPTFSVLCLAEKLVNQFACRAKK